VGTAEAGHEWCARWLTIAVVGCTCEPTRTIRGAETFAADTSPRNRYYYRAMPSDAASVSPMLLVSMPQMMDPNFARTVVLLAEYGRHGAFGLVVNRRMSEPAHTVVRAEPPIDICSDIHLYLGGPVEPSRAWVLTAHRELDPDALEVAEGVYLSASPALIRHALESPPDGAVRVVIGYAGWAAGQLDEELAASAWLMAPVDADLVFETPPETMWEAAIRRLGADPSALQSSSGVH
jgi:putative transcriptional regulator